VPDAEIDEFVAAFEASFVPEAETDAAPAPQTVEIAGRAINFLVKGDGAATPLLLLHGITADLESWMFNQPAIAAGRRMLALDLPGHGASTKDVGDGSPEWFAGVLAGFLDTVEIARVHLAGHSFGAAVSATFALAHPDRVASLSLIAPAGIAPEINGALLDALVAADRRRGARQALEQLVHDPELVGRDMIEAFLRHKRTDGVPAALAGIVAAGFADGQQRAVFTGRLADAGFPVQCIWGEDDRMIPAAQADALPDCIAVHRLPDTGHLAHMERAGQVNALLSAFLAAND
jgi:pyruvate dehydrogenase E2 component (dihydrolipoamide acetyltransferase)